MIDVHLHTQDFSVGTILDNFASTESGAIASFIGKVRDDHHQGQSLRALYIEHYPAMTERALAQLAQEAMTQFELHAVHITHRIGELPLGANIVLVLTAAGHRQAAIDGMRFVIETLKKKVPLWKQARYQDHREWLAPAATVAPNPNEALSD